MMSIILMMYLYCNSLFCNTSYAQGYNLAEIIRNLKMSEQEITIAKYSMVINEVYYNSDVKESIRAAWREQMRAENDSIKFITPSPNKEYYVEYIRKNINTYSYAYNQNNGIKRPIEISSFNGELSKTLSYNYDNKGLLYLTGDISNGKTNINDEKYNPEFHIYPIEISKILENKVIDGVRAYNKIAIGNQSVNIDGLNCIQISMSYNDGSTLTIWLTKDRYKPIRIEQNSKNLKIVVTNQYSVKSNYMYSTNNTLLISMNDNTDKSMKPSYYRELRIVGFEPYIEVNEKQFNLSFPPTTVVKDRSLGKTYVIK